MKKGKPSERQAKVLHKDGLRRFEEGDLKGAIDAYTRALALDRRNATLLNDRGIARKRFGDLHGAIDDYSAAIKADPKFWKALANRGNALGNLEEYAKAIVDYCKAIKLKPREAILYYYRGNAMACQMDYAAAFDDYSRAIELDAKLGEAFFCRGVTSWTMSKLSSADGAVTVVGAVETTTLATGPEVTQKHLQMALTDLDRANKILSPRAWQREELPRLLKEIRERLKP